MKLEWTLRARADLLDIGRWIARDDSAAAKAWLARLRERARLAADMPRSGRMVPEVGMEDVREVHVKNYRIVYRPRADRIRVLTVFEGHRSFPVGAAQEP